MQSIYHAALSRRSMLSGAAALAGAALLPNVAGGTAPASREFAITARPGRAPLVGGAYSETAVWAYNGSVPGPEIRVRQGDRIRINVKNELAEETTVHWHGVRVPNAMDGVPHLTQKPIAPGETFVYELDVPDAGSYGRAMRLDLLIDRTAEPGSRHAVRDSFYPTSAYTLNEIVYSGEPPLRREVPPPTALPPNTMPEPVLDGAERHEVAFGGGMMGRMPAHGIWSINGVSATGHVHEPLLRLKLGHTYVLALHNDTAWHHPIHLHGHSFRVLARNGQPTRFREWQDTVFMSPRERVDIAFVADNPGDWMLHCHILEHQEGGMMGVVRVA